MSDCAICYGMVSQSREHDEHYAVHFGDWGRRVRKWGVEVRDVIEVDTEQGWAIQYVRDHRGNLFLCDGVNDHAHAHLVYGVYEVAEP